MTILPKKKTTKDKNEGETTEHQKGHMTHSHQHHQSATDSRHEKATRSRNSPTRWLPTPTREEKLACHDTGVPFEGHENTTNHNKRRHRSPHRNHTRKHRGHCQTAHSSSTPQPVDYKTPPKEYEEAGYNSGDEYVPPPHPDNIDELEIWFEKTLKEKKRWEIKKMGEDGACLFRAVADQVYGDQEMHSVIRKNCVEYMQKIIQLRVKIADRICRILLKGLRKNADYYSQYVTEDFTTYLNRKTTENCHGNHVEMQAISELFNRPIEVYQYSLEPINTFNCPYETENTPIRISYHRNIHYNSVVDPYQATIGVGLGLPGLQPGLADKTQMHDAVRQSEDTHIEQCMLQDKLRETDWEVTQETIEEQVARDSYLQWLKDNENQARRQASPRSASATCSSSADSMYVESLGSPELRQGRSPRNRSSPNSAQNSPVQMDSSEQSSPRPTVSGYKSGGSPKSQKVLEGPSLGATGWSSPKPQEDQHIGFVETNSLMNCYNPSLLGMSDWADEDDILAQVMAQSQQEYLDSLKKNAASSSSFISSPSSSSSTAAATVTSNSSTTDPFSSLSLSSDTANS